MNAMTPSNLIHLSAMRDRPLPAVSLSMWSPEPVSPHAILGETIPDAIPGYTAGALAQDMAHVLSHVMSSADVGACARLERACAALMQAHEEAGA